MFILYMYNTIILFAHDTHLWMKSVALSLLTSSRHLSKAFALYMYRISSQMLAASSNWKYNFCPKWFSVCFLLKLAAFWDTDVKCSLFFTCKSNVTFTLQVCGRLWGLFSIAEEFCEERNKSSRCTEGVNGEVEVFLLLFFNTTLMNIWPSVYLT